MKSIVIRFTNTYYSQTDIYIAENSKRNYLNTNRLLVGFCKSILIDYKKRQFCIYQIINPYTQCLQIVNLQR